MRVALILVALCACSTATPPITTTPTPRPADPPFHSTSPTADLEEELERAVGGTEPSPTAAIGIARYENGDHAAAVRALIDVKDEPVALFFLGKSLFRLGLRIVALETFSTIASAGPAHPYHAASLPWLVALARVVPDEVEVDEVIGRSYPSALDAPSVARVRGEVAYRLARNFYDLGEYDQAMERLDAIPEASPFYAKGLHLRGVSEVRRYDVHAAGAAYVKAFEYAKRRPELLREATLALLQLARLQYSVGNYPHAIRAYRALDADSEWRDDAQFELAWAYYMVDRTKAREILRGLNAPSRVGRPMPAAMLLDATIAFADCRYDDALAVLAAYSKRYKPVGEQLRATTAAHEDAIELYEYVRPMRPPLVWVADTTGRLERSYAIVDELARETAIAGKLALGGDIADTLALRDSLARNDAGRRVGDALARAASEIRDLERDAVRIKFEILSAQRDAIASGKKACAKE